MGGHDKRLQQGVGVHGRASRHRVGGRWNGQGSCAGWSLERSSRSRGGVAVRCGRASGI